MKWLLLFFVFSVICLLNIRALKILVVFPLPARSHYILGSELGKGLAALGHEVTVLSSFEEKYPPRNYKEILLDEFAKKREAERKDKYNMFEMENISPYYQLAFLNGLGGLLADTFFNNTKLRAFISSNATFDVVIVEEFFNSAMKVLATHFNAHLVLFSTVGATRWVNNMVVNPEPPSYCPDILLSFGSEMTFYERLYNVIFGFVSDVVLYQYFYPSQNKVLKKYFPNAPHLDDIQYNVSLVITNSHESISAAVPRVPNMINIGGFHVNPPKELPKDLKEFMDNSKEGVIYFSLGSNLVPSAMPKEKKDIILKVLGSRKERVLWKWDEESLPNKPRNVMISKWFPQQAILAHPNCKLFISHGGLLSITEAVYLAVPVLAFPIFGDQKLNAARIKSKGFGLTLPFSQINEKDLVHSLNELIDNPSYRQNAQLASKIMHDRPIKPIEEVDYWIKYIVRHNGAPHLRVAGLKLPLYQYYLLDVYAAILAGFVLVGYLIKKLFGLCCCRGHTSTTRKKTKKE